MKYIFAGNRFFVLEEILNLNLDVQILAISGSYLEKHLKKYNINYTCIDSKNDLLNYLENNDYDVFISNGCPYILPIKKLKNAKYINIHPSYLPDLKGVDPNIGSILYKRDAGATCHIINEIIDGGDIISKEKIPYSDDLSIELLYQLSFIAEKNVFIDGYKKNFIPSEKQISNDNHIYYKRSKNDQNLDLSENIDLMVRKISSFSNLSQGCNFVINNKNYKIHQIKFLFNPYLINYANSFKEYEVILNYENCIVFKKNDKIIQLKSLTCDLSNLKKGTILI